MNRRPGSASDPLWFKDAVIYELHVKAFADGNADGIGDFSGLIGKLDYLEGLGVTCIWLLPFFPSPLRDDGYDISDYMNVHPTYGTMDDFRRFLAAAHERDLQVMIELVVNHTSDQHPWFQAARQAPPGSPERDYYVWSDTDEKYRNARIIFTDTEKSNWTWDQVAKAYYWHRFFSHQPDLNFDNPQVLDEVVKVMRFWLDLGVDGLRLDAIPYLVERDGTNCENLPETHTVIKKIRAEMDAGYTNRMILAEANQWPSDVRPYFGEGDECHMAFHFPLMPRIYMALRQEDRVPIIDILSHTPEIPETCQWGLFLRNHDELTLEMVTSDERDYMYLAYSADPRTRINLGIRRRLAPLVDNSRRRIELLNSLLFSLPGTPIIYYGDEIGMGDNVYLGDRNGVRTPMQWSSDRNAGFSRVNPAMLYSPVIMDPVWGYEAVNVEAEDSDPSSLLNWMRNMIALRKLFRVFGRGTLRFLTPANRTILAYLRSFNGEQVLCVMNLSRYAQPVDLDLSDLAGMTPVEMLGYVEFPRITRDGYRLTLSPYGFLWLELHGEPERPKPTRIPEEEPVSTDQSWSDLIPALEESVLPAWLVKQRWFSGKSRPIQSVRVTDWSESGAVALMFLRVSYHSGDPEDYFAPLVFRGGILEDGVSDDTFCRTLLTDGNSSMKKGLLRRRQIAGIDGMPGEIRRMDSEQSNSSVIFGQRYVLKIFRRQYPGPNPEVEIGRHFAGGANSTLIPTYLASIDYIPASEPASSVAIVQSYVPNEGDGWTWMTSAIRRWMEVSGRNHPGDPDDETIEATRVLGRRTAQLHAALSTAGQDPAFAPETFTSAEVASLISSVRDEANQTFDLLKSNLPFLPDESIEMAGRALRRRREIVDGLHLLSDRNYGLRIRIHGDFHLGQILRTRDGFVIIDFEGEPARPPAQRRAKYSPLRDVAGMMRSFDYAARSTLLSLAADHPESFGSVESCARSWAETASAEYLGAYLANEQVRALLPQADEDLRSLLSVCRVEKALYELRYELSARPAWVRIPLAGVLAFPNL